MPLTQLYMTGCGRIPNLEPLCGMSLTHLHAAECLLFPDLSSCGMPLVDLHLANCNVPSIGLANLKKLKRLMLVGCPRVNDLEPLRGMPLAWLRLYGTPIRDLDSGAACR